ncbi:MBL fold metallo-hydrolase [Pedobacter sp. HMWF019]|uniref:MBL fold metallo-hydrolase n=1 Tax=Pedobacter sp. HMWF019 TaxID=2056856 RepID=UPI000D359870|nr:MBL fold metallo-hydrolase [Pedobacter sp. HMWF019]PTS91686.1 MBL fold metallo-hydrolase [Pedobacter sp. HMWF019]
MENFNRSESKLSYAVMTAVRKGVTRDLPHGPEDLQWVSNSSTLIYGEKDAVLVDTFTSISQNNDLVNWVKSFNRKLTHIYITHGHGDHWFGIGQLLKEFPDAAAVGTANTVGDAPINDLPAYREHFWEKLFPGEIPESVYPSVLEGSFIELEGHRIEIIDTGHTDTAHSTSLWVPDLRLVVAGDVVYNHTHPFTAETNTESREHWAQAAEKLAALNPDAVISGHKQPELSDAPETALLTAQYLRNFNRIESETSTALELYNRMLELYPRWANPGSLWGGSKTAKQQSVL